MYNKIMNVPFNKPFCAKKEKQYIEDCINSGKISSCGKYTDLCEKWFFSKYKKNTILTISCTAALEMAALLINIQKGDEIIMPAFTFVTTATAFVLRGGTPVFVDINANTLNIDENLIERAITRKTKAIVVVHYAGVACNMDRINKIAKKYNLYVIEDAAHSINAKYKSLPLGTIGDIGCISFHTTKNITSGEGGAIFINNRYFLKRAEIISEKGTNRKSFMLGKTDKYTWCDIGSSFKPSEINAAILYSQLDDLSKIEQKKLNIWNKYFSFFKKYEEKGYIKRAVIPSYCKHNAHIFYILFQEIEQRNMFIKFLKANGIEAVFHYVPLHTSPAGKKYGRFVGSLENTCKISDTIVRLPLFYDLTDEQLKYIFKVIDNFFCKNFKPYMNK